MTVELSRSGADKTAKILAHIRKQFPHRVTLQDLSTLRIGRPLREAAIRLLLEQEHVVGSADSLGGVISTPPPPGQPRDAWIKAAYSDVLKPLGRWCHEDQAG